jgi:GxxExxY protein
MLTRTTGVLDPETEELVEQTIGCAIVVHKTLGPGYLEAIYHDALAIELDEAGLAFEREVSVPLLYRGRPLRAYRLDLVVGGSVLVELKAVDRLDPVHFSQVISYLKASGLRVGLLMNFNRQKLTAELRRIVL